MKRKTGLLILALLFAVILAPAVLAAEDTPAAATTAAAAMTVAAAIALTIVVVQFIKEKLIPALWDKLGDTAKFVVTALASAGVTLYKYLIKDSLALDLGAVWFVVQVFVGAWFGYETLKAVAPALSRNSNKPA